MIDTVEEIMRSAQIQSTGSLQAKRPVGTVRVRLPPPTSAESEDLIEHRLNPDPENPDYTVALNLLPASPNWMASIGALPMHLGLDLRGGVHFLLEVDMRGALTGRYDTIANDIRSVLRDARISSGNIERSDLSVVANFDTAADVTPLAPCAAPCPTWRLWPEMKAMLPSALAPPDRRPSPGSDQRYGKTDHPAQPH